MDAIVRCISGLEEVTLQELKECLCVEGTLLFPGIILFHPFSQKHLADFCYATRSSFFVYELFSSFDFATFEELQEKLSILQLKDVKEPFVVRCERKGKHTFTSQEVERFFGEIIHISSSLKVDLNSPRTIIFVDIQDNHCFVGRDYAGYKLNKREYRIKTHPLSLNPCIAYVLLRISGWKSKDILLDPFSRSGEICIEAALSALQIPGAVHFEDKLAFTKFLDYSFTVEAKEKKLSIHCIDSLHLNVRNSETNAKLAGVAQYLTFSRFEVEWLDTKFEKESIDQIVTVPPSISRIVDQKEALRVYNELFYQAEYILKKAGTLILLSKHPEFLKQAASKFIFILEKEITFEHGTEQFFILRFSKKTI